MTNILMSGFLKNKKEKVYHNLQQQKTLPIQLELKNHEWLYLNIDLIGLTWLNGYIYLTKY